MRPISPVCRCFDVGCLRARGIAPHWHSISSRHEMLIGRIETRLVWDELAMVLNMTNRKPIHCEGSLNWLHNSLIDITIDSTSLKYSNFVLAIYIICHSSESFSPCFFFVGISLSFSISLFFGAPFSFVQRLTEGCILYHAVYQLLLCANGVCSPYAKVWINGAKQKPQQRLKKRGKIPLIYSFLETQIDYGDEVIKCWWLILCFDFSPDLQPFTRCFFRSLSLSLLHSLCTLCLSFRQSLISVFKKSKITTTITIIICFMLAAYSVRVTEFGIF